MVSPIMAIAQPRESALDHPDPTQGLEAAFLMILGTCPLEQRSAFAL